MRSQPAFLLIVTLGSILAASSLNAQNTAFTYQGRLQVNNGLASGTYNLKLTVYDALTGGNISGGPITNAVGVTNGLFTTTLDLGAAPFPGASRWLEIAVRQGNSGNFNIVVPRQRITAAPYSIMSSSVADGSVTASKLNAGLGSPGQVLKLGASGLTWGTDLNAGGTVTSVGTGVGLTGGPVTTTGTLAIDTSVIPRLAATNVFTGSNLFNGVVSAGNLNNRLIGTFIGNGAGLSNVAASSVVNFSGSLAGDVTGTQAATVVGRIRGVNVASTGPLANQFLRYNGASWTPGPVVLDTDVTGTLAPILGGSGQSSYVAGDLLYAPSANTLARRAIGLSGQVLTVANSVPTWAGANAHNHFGQTWTGTDTDGLFVQNTSITPGVSALTGSATANTALNYGVFGQTASQNGIGVQGTALSAVGATTGVAGQSASPLGTGVYGLASATTGNPTGLYGEAFSTNGIGVYGVGSASTGVSVGVYGETFSAQGYGLYTPNRLYVGDTAFFVGHASLSTGARLFADSGTPTSPSISFTISPNAGMFTPSANVLSLGTSSTERLRIAADGKVGLGRVPTVNLFEIAGEASKATAGSWLANSDARIKTDVRSLQGALDTIEHVRPVSFRYTEEYRRSHPEIENKTYYNVIAQEFAEVFPGSVKSSGEMLDGKAVLQVDTYPATIHSIAAIQELDQRVKTQQAELTRLKAQNAELEKRLAAFEKLAETLVQKTARP